MSADDDQGHLGKAHFKEGLKNESSADLIQRIEGANHNSGVGPLKNQLEWQELKRRLLQMQ